MWCYYRRRTSSVLIKNVLEVKKFSLAIIGAIALLGCAKGPNSPPGAQGRKIKFWIKLAAPVSPNFVYIVAINDRDDPTGAQGGPSPVIARPWGNGFVANKATHFIRFQTSQPSGGYSFNLFTDLVTLLTYVQTGIPFNYVTPGASDSTLEFEILLSQLRPPPGDPNLITGLQINLLTMDRVPTDPGDNNPKFWDALGNSLSPATINDYLTIDAQQDRIYRNSDNQIEPANDVADPSLDIIDWRIEVRSQ